MLGVWLALQHTLRNAKKPQQWWSFLRRCSTLVPPRPLAREDRVRIHVVVYLLIQYTVAGNGY